MIQVTAIDSSKNVVRVSLSKPEDAAESAVALQRNAKAISIQDGSWVLVYPARVHVSTAMLRKIIESHAEVNLS